MLIVGATPTSMHACCPLPPPRPAPARASGMGREDVSGVEIEVPDLVLGQGRLRRPRVECCEYSSGTARTARDFGEPLRRRTSSAGLVWSMRRRSFQQQQKADFVDCTNEHLDIRLTHRDIPLILIRMG